MRNQIFNEDCLQTMSRMKDNSIDLVVTSPPYDNLRSYGQDIDQTWGESVWEPIIEELCRIIKHGGVVVWVVNDATINGSETGSSFKQALYFMECGCNLHDTMIWIKKGGGAVGSCYTYTQNIEYMFILSKGRPSTINLIRDQINVTRGTVRPKSKGGRSANSNGVRVAPKHSKRDNWWYIPPQKNNSHPAVFPEQLAHDHIISWSNEGDLIYDPFLGSGTTAKVAVSLNRDYVGSELSEDYFKIAQQRITNVQISLF